METSVTLRQAYLVMFEFLELQWARLGKPDELGGLLGNLALWDKSSGRGDPMDAAVFPEWLECAHRVLGDERGRRYAGADIGLLPE